MVVQKTYYYLLDMMLDGKKVLRQGTVLAADPLNAIDRIRELGNKVWKRSILSVTVTDPNTGKVLAKSTIGDYAKQHSTALTALHIAAAAANSDETWLNYQYDAWSPYLFATLYRPPVFGRLVKFA